MKTIVFSVFSLLLISLGVFSAPLSTDDSDPIIDTATIKNISDAILYATYLSQHASTIVDYLPLDTTNPSVCFIERRDPNTNVSAIDRLRQDRDWITPFNNYSSDIFEAKCGNLRGLNQSQQIICIEIANMIETMNTLTDRLDQIIPDKQGSGEYTSSTTESCWSTSLHQQYWNFNALHALAALYIKIDLKDLQTELIHHT